MWGHAQRRRTPPPLASNRLGPASASPECWKVVSNGNLTGPKRRALGLLAFRNEVTGRDGWTSQPCGHTGNSSLNRAPSDSARQKYWECESTACDTSECRSSVLGTATHHSENLAVNMCLCISYSCSGRTTCTVIGASTRRSP